jgi:hypothetical protein
MPLKTISSTTLALALAGGMLLAVPAAPAFAQSEKPSASATDTAATHAHRRHGRFKATPEEHAVLADLRALTRVYLQSNRASELPALYRSVLAKTDNETIRKVANRMLERVGQAPQNPDLEIARLTRQLNDGLAGLPAGG